MLKPGGYELYIERMLKNPKVKPVFEEYYNLRGRYPPFYAENPTEEELIKEVKLSIEILKGRKTESKALS